ncbi:MAG: hypothetical protein NTV70_05685 [Acidobacteria bacterium]|nr:hypothetical protein [Acidobacteriota bacterium]
MSKHWASTTLLLAAVMLAGCTRVVLDGTVQKVRVYGVDVNSTVVLIDFRTVPRSLFMIGDTAVELETKDGKIVEGVIAAEVDIDRFLESNPLQGRRFNPTLHRSEKLAKDQPADRMIAANFPLALADVENRKALRIKVTEVDGPVSVIEKK